MIARDASCGVVTLAALDLRAGPEHQSELTSQLLLGEVVRVRAADARGLWIRVENESDGYRGWARSWGLVPCGPARAASWIRLACGRVLRAYAEIRTGRGDGALVSPVYWNGRIIVGSARRGYRRAELPDGRAGWIEASAVLTSRRGIPKLMDRVRSLLGIPYLWGGRTPMGFDCSGLIQQIASERGIALPRDAHQQWKATRPRPRGATPRLGDLFFFGNPRNRPGHVGLSLGGGYYLHARGRVRINSIDPHNTLCDKQLLRQIRAIRRVDWRVR